MTEVDLDPAAEATARDLLAAFEAQNDDGTYRYTDDDVRPFVSLLLLLTGTGLNAPHTLSEPTRVLFETFLREIGVSPDHSTAEIETAACHYFGDNPPHPELLEAVRQVLGSA